MQTFGRTWLKAAVLVGAVLGLAACGQTTASPKPTAVTTTTTVPLASLGLIPAPPQITDRVVLAKYKVRAGTSIAGTLIVTNASSDPVDLTQRCEPYFALVISNPAVNQQPMFAAVCTHGALLLLPGKNRFPIMVTTTYLGCQQPGGTSDMPTPTCTSDGAPPLPAGVYHTVLYGSGNLALPEPPSVGVTLTK